MTIMNILEFFCVLLTIPIIPWIMGIMFVIIEDPYGLVVDNNDQTCNLGNVRLLLHKPIII